MLQGFNLLYGMELMLFSNLEDIGNSLNEIDLSQTNVTYKLIILTQQY